MCTNTTISRYCCRIASVASSVPPFLRFLLRTFCFTKHTDHENALQEQLLLLTLLGGGAHMLAFFDLQLSHLSPLRAVQLGESDAEHPVIKGC